MSSTSKNLDNSRIEYSNYEVQSSTKVDSTDPSLILQVDRFVLLANNDTSYKWTDLFY